MNPTTALYAKTGSVLLALMGLAACMMSPGKFTSSLDIRADRTFTFAYQGEVIVTDLDDMPSSSGDSDSDEETTGDEAVEDSTASVQTALYQQVAMTDEPGEAVDAAAATDENAPDSEEKIVKMQGIAEALMKEEGYRSVRYVGKNKFEIDYRITGKLDHGFIFPFNPDAQAIFPFVAIEMRKDGRVKISAPGFAENSDSKSAAMGGSGKSSAERSGIFTLTTNAEIISQNQEDGATTVPQGKQIQWKITPTTDTAPMAVLKFATGK
ncbi:MAG: hypothetical protein E2598_07670 [Sphingobium sp.]|nr:hypothetical protein [Sphingobium sp.]